MADMIPVPGEAEGRAMHERLVRLYPLHRALAGPGAKATLDELARDLPLAVSEYPSGTACWDWTIPKGFSVRGAYVRNNFV